MGAFAFPVPRWHREGWWPAQEPWPMEEDCSPSTSRASYSDSRQKAGVTESLPSGLVCWERQWRLPSILANEHHHHGRHLCCLIACSVPGSVLGARKCILSFYPKIRRLSPMGFSSQLVDKDQIWKLLELQKQCSVMSMGGRSNYCGPAIWKIQEAWKRIWDVEGHC